MESGVQGTTKALLDDLARHRLKAMDSWGWVVEPGPSNAQQVFGKCRMADKDIGTLLATSGKPAFFEPAHAPLRLLTKKWFHLLPVTVKVLQQLDWWHDEEGKFFCRRDSLRQVRKFELGVDGVDALLE